MADTADGSVSAPVTYTQQVAMSENVSIHVDNYFLNNQTCNVLKCNVLLNLHA